jgi:hypothetical protein
MPYKLHKLAALRLMSESSRSNIGNGSSAAMIPLRRIERLRSLP